MAFKKVSKGEESEEAKASLWIAGPEVVNTVKDLINKHHPHLALYAEEVVVLFKPKASEVDGVTLCGKSAKAPAVLNVLDPEHPRKFLITLAADAWKDMKDAERIALLDHHLCACRVKENEETGATTCYVAPPDVTFFKGEIERHGMWRTHGSAPSTNLLKEIFGDD